MRVLFLNVPYAGHILPTLPIVELLSQWGVDVHYCSIAASGFRDRIVSAGAQFSSLGRIQQNTETATSNVGVEPQSDFNTACDAIEEAQRIIDREAPTCIVYDSMCLWGKVLTKRFGIPAVKLHTTFPISHSFRPFPPFAPHKPWSEAIIRQQMATIKSLLTRVGLDSVDPYNFMMENEALNIVFMPRSLHPSEQSFGSAFSFVGSSINISKASTFPGSSSPEPPGVIYVSLGSLLSSFSIVLDTCISALRDRPERVVIATGSRVDPDVFGLLPGNIELRNFVPQVEALAGARVFVCHGGSNSVTESLSSGVPLVVIPFTEEARVMANRISELNLGVSLPALAGTTAHLIRSAITEVSSNLHIKSAVGKMKEEVRRAGGGERAAQQIAEFAAHWVA